MNQPANKPKNFFASLLGVRRNWPNDMNENESTIMQEHFLYLQELVQEKKILIAGPVFEPVFEQSIFDVHNLGWIIFVTGMLALATYLIIDYLRQRRNN